MCTRGRQNTRRQYTNYLAHPESPSLPKRRKKIVKEQKEAKIYPNISATPKQSEKMPAEG